MIETSKRFKQYCLAIDALAKKGIAAYPGIVQDFGPREARKIVFDVFFEIFGNRENALIMFLLFEKEMKLCS
jgi:hypothetical protein